MNCRYGKDDESRRTKHRENVAHRSNSSRPKVVTLRVPRKFPAQLEPLRQPHRRSKYHRHLFSRIQPADRAKYLPFVGIDHPSRGLPVTRDKLDIYNAPSEQP